MFFNTSDLGETAVFIEEGMAKLSLLSSNGSEKTIAILHSDSLLGEAALLLEAGHTPQVDLVAVAISEQLVAYHLTRTSFVELVQSDPEFSYELLKISAVKIQGLLAQLQLLVFAKSPALVARTLLALQDDFVIENSTKVLADMTQETLSQLTGQTRVTVSRALKALTQQGAVSVKRKRLCIVNEERLRAITN
jgi:CRP-like cAMP-binding protein